MKIKASVLTVVAALLFITHAPPVSAVVYVGGVIAGDSTWSNTEPIEVIGDVTVMVSAHLTIEPGAVIRFTPGTGLYNEGQLTAIGESDNCITFTSLADTAGGSPVPAGWIGIDFEMDSDGMLRHCNVRYAVNCIYLYRSTPMVDSCTIENFGDAGIYLDGGNGTMVTPEIRNCTIVQTDPDLHGFGRGFYVFRNVQMTAADCIVQNCLYGLEIYAYYSATPYFQITNCDIMDNIRGIYTHAGG